ncbi:MAG TPA: hypothetical protein DHV37_05720 [Erysipelotrichaceae bacterium]|nr:hypothetical protein [Erysipelotrichaceae bacterium]
MKTYDDLQKALLRNDEVNFILDVIENHKSSDLYKEAKIAYEYMRKRNVTIAEYQKLLYTITGETVPDNFSANYKFRNAFFPIFVNQECSYLLGNGVTFNNGDTKDKLGKNGMFDNQLIKAARYALWGAVSFGFLNLDHVDIFSVLEFAPIWDDDNGALRAGVRFWQIDKDKPLRATFFEEDGYTEYKWEDGEVEILKPKTPYQVTVSTSIADGTQILDGKNYPGFPIVPLWGNEDHQSELIGLREKIDGYDLIQSGFANDLDDASQIYWTITNAGGMQDMDLVKFVERMKTVKAAVVDEEGSRAEAHTLEVPYAARTQMLVDLKDSLYRDAMALDTDKISAGTVTATQIESSYENLNLKVDSFETCVTDFINELLSLLGIEDDPSYKRSKIINQIEDTQMILSAAQYLDDETILKHLPFLSPDEIDSILDKRVEEEAARYEELANDYEMLKSEIDNAKNANPETEEESANNEEEITR